MIPTELGLLSEKKSEKISMQLIDTADTLNMCTNCQKRAPLLQKHDILMKILTLQDLSLLGVSLVTTQTEKSFSKVIYTISSVFHDCQSQLRPQIWLQSCPQQVLYWRLLNQCHSCSWYLACIKWQMALITSNYIAHFKRETYASLLCFESC